MRHFPPEFAKKQRKSRKEKKADLVESEKSDAGEVLGGELLVVRRGGMAVTAMVNFTPESACAR